MLVKTDPAVGAECARAVQRSHERIKQCYITHFEAGGGAGKGKSVTEKDDDGDPQVNSERRRLTGRALLREILRLHPVLPRDPLELPVKKAAAPNPQRLSLPRDARSPSNAASSVVLVTTCQVDDFRLQWIRRHLKKMACVVFSYCCLLFLCASVVVGCMSERHSVYDVENEHDGEWRGKTCVISDFLSSTCGYLLSCVWY